jgi:DNA processing protein
MSTSSEHVDFVALSLLPIGCWRRVGVHLHAGVPPGCILERVLGERRSDPPVDPSALRSRAVTALARAEDRGIRLVPWSDAAYPAALSAIVDPPPALWVRGNLAALSRPAVAVVGSRAGSPYGLTVAERLAADLAGRGVVVVSGLARGVDSAAHRGALAANGSTLAVLGSGADVIYPAEHKSLARAIETDGAVISELVPGTPPQKRFFPLRNRLISGLSRAVLIVEAGEKSGSLITARCALEQGREVLAVPGNVLSGRNRGGHGLLRDGAKIVESADDILEELCVPAFGRPGAEGAAGPEDPVLLSLPAGESCDLDTISERTGLRSARLLPRLFELEMQGLVKRVGGGRFVRV